MKPSDIRSLTNIKSSVILQALRQAKPITAVGRVAVENFKTYLVQNSMNAIALENSIMDLTGDKRDAGLESLIATLKGVMPESKRRIAVAYELLQFEQPGSFMAVGKEAFDALSSLYNMNATKIIDEINGGVLNAFKTNPTIARLISWARAANKVAPEQKIITDGGVETTMTPVLNIATAGDDMLVAIDGSTFLQGERNALTYIPAISDIEGLPGDIQALLVCIRQLHASTLEPNLLLLNSDILEYVNKVLPMESFAIDLLGGINELVRINDNPMSVDKARALLMENKDELIASMLMSDAAKDALQIVNTIMNLFEKYRGAIVGNNYANVFRTQNTTSYFVEKDGRIAVVNLIDGNVMNSKSYDSVFDALSDDMFVSNPELHKAISTAYSSELKNESSRIAIRKQVLLQLSEERKQYESLLARISDELDNLATVSDANPEKETALKELKSKVEGSLAAVAAEIEKLANK